MTRTCDRLTAKYGGWWRCGRPATVRSERVCPYTRKENTMITTTDESAQVAATIDQSAIEGSYANLRALNTEGQRLTFRELRAALTPALRKELLEQTHQPALIQIYALLRRLRPADVRTAQLAHRALVRQLVRNVRWYGYLDGASWPNLARLLFNFLDSHGLDYNEDGRWTWQGVRT